MGNEITAEKKHFWFVQKDGGFTGVGVVIALALTLALLYTSAQVYWVNSTAGDVQFAADAGALAAENIVAEYYVVARIADAVVLSLSLFGIIVFGVAIVVSCIPYCQGVGTKIMEFGKKVFDTRDSISKNAHTALTKLQKAMPFLAAANAATVISSNKFSGSGEAGYLGVAILIPWQSEEMTDEDNSQAEQMAKNTEGDNAQTEEKMQEAQKAKEKMDSAKQRAYVADCGGSPNYCMYERANKLAGLTGAKNPHYSSVESWQFSVALVRAKDYYAQRIDREAPTSNNLQDRIKSKVRKKYYEYAKNEVSKGYANVDGDGVLEAYFPIMPTDYSGVRKTPLYTDAMFAVDSEGSLHGFSDCSEYSGSGGGWGSIADLENGRYESCSTCDLSMATIGSVANASSFNTNGFEYYYRIVAEEAKAYQDASQEYKEAQDEAKKSAESAIDKFDAALAALKTKCLDPKPPGRNGCIAIAVDASAHNAPSSLSSSLVGGNKTLAPRVAISAAALVEDKASSGETILSSFFERAKNQANGPGFSDTLLGWADGLFGVWGDVLLAYTNGIDGLTRGVETLIGSIPFINSTPLATWAKDAITETLESFGLQGVNLSAPKPVIVNTIHVANASGSKAMGALGLAKEKYMSIPGAGSGTLLEGVVDLIIVEVEGKVDDILDREFELFTIDLGVLGSMPVKVKIPVDIADGIEGKLSEYLGKARDALVGGREGYVWE